jgi:hypothetical protein
VALGYRAGRSEVWGSSSILDDLLHLSIIIPPNRRCCGPVGLRDSVEAYMKMPTRALQTRAPALVSGVSFSTLLACLHGPDIRII